jgi:hypothetical protein
MHTLTAGLRLSGVFWLVGNCSLRVEWQRDEGPGKDEFFDHSNLHMPKQAQHSFLHSFRCTGRTRLVFATALCAALCPIPLSSETVSAEYDHPIEVQLLNFLDVHHSDAGSTFFVKVVDDWTGSGCFFRNGQIIEARVVLATSRGKRSIPSQLAVSFDKVPCLYNKATMDLVLAAAFFDPTANISNTPFPIMSSSMAKTGSVNTIQRSFVVNGLELAAMTGKGAKRPGLKPGDVVGMKGITLHIGAGPGRSSILESSTRDVWLEKESMLVLVPASVAFQRPFSSDPEVDSSPENSPTTEPGENPAASDVHTTAAAAPAPLREFLPCEPPACNVDLPTTGREQLGKAIQSIAVRPLGYAPRPQREIEKLDDDDALAWLGSHQLLMAFNPHKLIPRGGATNSTATARRIHAVVLDLSSHKVVSTADWDLPDQQAYLWQLSENRVLAHVGDELRVLTEGMRADGRIPLDGPLAFIRTSPNGELMAIAVTHERHSPEMHSKLRDALGHDPDEDVQIRILDKNLQVVAQATSSRGIMPPILLNEGQVRLLASPGSRYRLEMLPWQGGALSIARFSSACLPLVSSFAPDLLFVQTCALRSRIHEYRVMRPNGVVVLQGKSNPQNLGQGASGNDKKFAVKVLHAKQSVIEGSTFRGADLDYAEVCIYRSEDAGKIGALHIATPPATRGGFALSSDGSQLAVLSNSQLGIFSVP